jgi:hypothetical protein
MSNSVTITAMVGSALNKVTLTQTGPTTASVRTQVWKFGSNLAAAADTDTTIELTDCAASADSSILTADGPAGILWMTPKVILTLASAATTPPTYTATIDVTGVGPEDSDNVASISEADYQAALVFVAAAKFPVAA